MEAKFFYVSPDPVTGYGLLDAEWSDIPSTIYSGGLIDIHTHTNMSGIMYTPGPLEWGPGIARYGEKGIGGSVSRQPALSYINGSIITGYGMAGGYSSYNRTSKFVMVYDLQAVDNATTSLLAIKLRRYDWQRLY